MDHIKNSIAILLTPKKDSWDFPKIVVNTKCRLSKPQKHNTILVSVDIEIISVINVC
jgi:hypothetical protein